MGSLNATAKGNRTGAFSVTTAAPCPGFEPGLPYFADASGCGDFKYNLRMDFKQKGAFQYVIGPDPDQPRRPLPLTGRKQPVSLHRSDAVRRQLRSAQAQLGSLRRGRTARLEDFGLDQEAAQDEEGQIKVDHRQVLC